MAKRKDKMEKGTKRDWPDGFPRRVHEPAKRDRRKSKDELKKEGRV